jgi:acyl carrier protein
MNEILSEPNAHALEEILTRELGVKREQLKMESRIQEDYSADSLTVMEIDMAVEERFSLSIPDERWEKVRTIGDLYELLADFLKDR